MLDVGKREELNAMGRNPTWECINLPKGKFFIGCRWVFKIKSRPAGIMDRYLARLVAKGHAQAIVIQVRL